MTISPGHARPDRLSIVVADQLRGAARDLRDAGVMFALSGDTGRAERVAGMARGFDIAATMLYGDVITSADDDGSGDRDAGSTNG